MVTGCKQCRDANTVDPAAALLAPVDDGTFGGPRPDETMDNLSADASSGTLWCQHAHALSGRATRRRLHAAVL